MKSISIKKTEFGLSKDDAWHQGCWDDSVFKVKFFDKLMDLKVSTKYSTIQEACFWPHIDTNIEVLKSRLSLDDVQWVARIGQLLSYVGDPWSGDFNRPNMGKIKHLIMMGPCKPLQTQTQTTRMSTKKS